MSFYHPKRYKVSFVEPTIRADIGGNRLEIGAPNVYFHPRIDDKSSWTDLFKPSGRTDPCLAAALPRPPRTGQLVRPRTPRHRRFPRRCHLRSLQAILAGLNGSQGRRRLIRGTPAIF